MSIRTRTPRQKDARLDSRGRSTRSLSGVVVGSALFWAQGYLIFLSPVLFPSGVSTTTSIGIEYGFLVSQTSLTLFALAITVVSKWRSIFIGRMVFFIGAVLMVLSAIVLYYSLVASMLWLTLLSGAVHGFSYPLLGIAWGTRYSLGSENMRSLVILSFLVAYILYFIVAALPHPLAVFVVCLAPLVSWVFWNSDAKARHFISCEVFSVQHIDGESYTLGEFLAGTWETKVLPWKPLAPLMVASFVGNFMASIIMGKTYSGAETLIVGGVVVCSCIAIMALALLVSRKGSFSVTSVYGITLTFTSTGLAALLVIGAPAVYFSGALIQGCAFFLQVLIILVVTQSTQEKGISPLLSFSVGLGVISSIVFVSYALGEAVISSFGSNAWVRSVCAGISLLVLVFMLIYRVSKNSSMEEGQDAPHDDVRAEEESAPSNDRFDERVERYAQHVGLTRRETEVLGYLAQGRSLPYIADALFVTTGTVKTHTARIYRKFNISSKQELIDLFVLGSAEMEE